MDDYTGVLDDDQVIVYWDMVLATIDPTDPFQDNTSTPVTMKETVDVHRVEKRKHSAADTLPDIDRVPQRRKRTTTDSPKGSTPSRTTNDIVAIGGMPSHLEDGLTPSAPRKQPGQDTSSQSAGASTVKRYDIKSPTPEGFDPQIWITFPSSKRKNLKTYLKNEKERTMAKNYQYLTPEYQEIYKDVMPHLHSGEVHTLTSPAPDKVHQAYFDNCTREQRRDIRFYLTYHIKEVIEGRYLKPHHEGFTADLREAIESHKSKTDKGGRRKRNTQREPSLRRHINADSLTNNGSGFEYGKGNDPDELSSSHHGGDNAKRADNEDKDRQDRSDSEDSTDRTKSEVVTQTTTRKATKRKSKRLAQINQMKQN